MHTKLSSKMAKNYCHSDRKFTATCLQVLSKPFNDILGRNTDYSACIDIMNIDYCIVGNFDRENINEFDT